ncbi:MAG: peptidoglycan-binding protein [Chromatiaceae bacterium]
MRAYLFLGFLSAAIGLYLPGEASATSAIGMDAPGIDPPQRLAGLADFFESLDKRGVSPPPKGPSKQSGSAGTAKTTGSGSLSSYGLSRDDNRRIQQALTDLGYSPGPIDGLPGEETKTAIRRYQEDHNLLTTGSPSLELLEHMELRIEARNQQSTAAVGQDADVSTSISADGTDNSQDPGQSVRHGSTSEASLTGVARPDGQVAYTGKATRDGGWALTAAAAPPEPAKKPIIYTPEKNDPERKAILDALRRTYAKNVVFLVHYLKVSGDWAWARVTATVDGQPDYEPQSGLVRRVRGKWTEVASLDQSGDCDDEPVCSDDKRTGVCAFMAVCSDRGQEKLYAQLKKRFAGLPLEIIEGYSLTALSSASNKAATQTAPTTKTPVQALVTENAPNLIKRIAEALPYASLSSYIYGCKQRCSQYCDRSGRWLPLLDSRDLPQAADALLTNTQSNTANSTEPVRREDQFKGFHAAAFRNVKTNEIAIVYEGTSDLHDLQDWKANLGQPFLKPSQYSRAIEFAQEVETRFCSATKDCESRVVLTGHSLGGGLAQYTAIKLGRKAYIFNGAGLWDSTAGNVDTTIAARAKIIHYRSKGYKFGYRLGADFVPFTGVQFSEETIDIPITLPLWAWDTITVGVITHNMARLRDHMLSMVLAHSGTSASSSQTEIRSSPTEAAQSSAVTAGSSAGKPQTELNASTRSIVKDILDAYGSDLKRINLVADHADYAVLAWAAYSDFDALKLAKERGWAPIQSLANENLTFGAIAATLFASDRGDRVIAYSKADPDPIFLLEQRRGNYVSESDIAAARTAGAREVARDHCEAAFVGHTLGGQLAQIAHLETGRHAVGFNSTPPSGEELKTFAGSTWDLSDNLIRFRSPSDPDTSSDVKRYITVANISPASDGLLSKVVNADYGRSISVLAQAMQNVRLARDEGWIDAYLRESAISTAKVDPKSNDAGHEWGPGIVPDSSIDFSRNLCAGKEIRSCVTDLGVAQEAISFSTAVEGNLTGDEFATEFLELGKVDLARMWNYRYELETPLLINGAPPIIAPTHADNLQRAFTDGASKKFLARYPQAAAWRLGVPGHRLLPEGGQRFVIATTLTDFCRACPTIGGAVTQCH